MKKLSLIALLAAFAVSTPAIANEDAAGEEAVLKVVKKDSTEATEEAAPAGEETAAPAQEGAGEEE